MDATRLSSFAALRSFEAAARLGSFQRAADALGLTASAISHQVRTLEMEVGQALFIRGRRGVTLTPAGEALRPFVDRGFAELRRGVASLRQEGSANVVRINAAPAFAAAFLAHRVSSFETLHPGLELRLDVGNAVTDLHLDAADAAIRCVLAPPRELFAEEVLPILSGPVGTSELVAGLERPGQLASLPWISSHQDRGGWKTWLRAAGEDALVGRRETNYETLDAAVQAALAGVGVAILPFSLIGAHLASGAMLAPFPTTIRSKLSYWLVCRRGEQDLPKVARFRRWLADELKGARHKPEAGLPTKVA